MDKNKQAVNKVLTDYIVENANLKIQIEQLKTEFSEVKEALDKLETELSDPTVETSENEEG